MVVRGHNLETGHTLHTPDHNGRGEAPPIYALLWKGQSEAVHVGLWEASVGPQLLAAGQRQGIVRGRSPLTELTSARRALCQLVLLYKKQALFGTSTPPQPLEIID